jgi:thioesterase domain-containing protein
MKVRPLLYLTAFVAAILGATASYLALSVPNDLRADALLKQARKELTDGKNDQARDSLSKIVLQYPRTDAAAAATVALASLSKKERDDLARAISVLRSQNEQQAQLLAALQKTVTDVKNAPPKIVTVQAPAPKPAAVKKTPPKKKTTPKKKTPTKRRRR